MSGLRVAWHTPDLSQQGCQFPFASRPAPCNRIALRRNESSQQKCQVLTVVKSDHRGHRNLPKSGQRHILQTFGVGLRVGGEVLDHLH